jgi:hypothetical protein
VKNLRNFLLVLVLSVLASSITQAQATRTWVSGVGDDANPCSRTAPCKTFAGAISKTVAGGEIDALDPGGFGALTITKGITIDGGGGQVGSVLVAGTNGIVVSAGASDVVTLRNLSINGTGSGINGINFLSGGVLHIEHCAIFGFTNNGINIVSNMTAKIFVLDTTSGDNKGSGILGRGTGGTVFVAIDRSRFENNAIGVFAEDFSEFAVKDSDASGNGNIGFCSDADSGGAILNITNSMTTGNGATGIQAGGGAAAGVVRLSGVLIAGNGGSGMVVATNGSIISYRNNYNSDSGSPSSTIVPQ